MNKINFISYLILQNQIQNHQFSKYKKLGYE